MKICKDSGLIINQSKVIKGENYIGVNYRANSQVVRVWILWEAKDEFFSPRLKNSNARTLNLRGLGRTEAGPTLGVFPSATRPVSTAW